jgi:drug/metabolite transporter (DMT)-like permease
MVTYLFPLGGVILGVTFLNEQLTWHVIAGAALIVASLAIANMKSNISARTTERETRAAAD